MLFRSVFVLLVVRSRFRQAKRSGCGFYLRFLPGELDHIIRFDFDWIPHGLHLRVLGTSREYRTRTNHDLSAATITRENTEYRVFLSGSRHFSSSPLETLKRTLALAKSEPL